MTSPAVSPKYKALKPAGGVSPGSSAAPVAVVNQLGYQSVAQIVRPSNTTAFAANDAVGQADVTTAANAGTAILSFLDIGPSGGIIELKNSMLMIALTALPASMAGFMLNLYDAAPTAILDNAPFDVIAGDRAKFLGTVDLGTPVDLGSTLVVEKTALSKHIKLADGSTTLYGVLATVGGYTPASGETLTIKLNAKALC